MSKFNIASVSQLKDDPNKVHIWGYEIDEDFCAERSLTIHKDELIALMYFMEEKKIIPALPLYFDTFCKDNNIYHTKFRYTKTIA